MTDRPRRSGEDVVTWAIETGRFREQRAGYWRRRLAEGSARESDIEALASVDLPGSGTPVYASAGNAGRPVRAGSAPAGDPAGEYLANDAMYREASTVAPPPDLFPGGGSLPLATASGLDPRAMSGVPWWLRPAIAEAPTRQEAVELLQAASTPEGVAASAMDKRFTNSPGLGDFKARVRSWAMESSRVLGEQEREAQYEQAKSVAAAAAASLSDDRSDDELYDVIFGSADRHRAGLAETQRKHNEARRNGGRR